VAAGDVDGDGRAEIIAAAGPGGGPQVSVYDGRSGAALLSFFAYPAFFSGGVYVAAGDLHGTGRASLITGTGAGGGPQVSLFDGRTGAARASFFALPQEFTGGVRVAFANNRGDGRGDLIAAAGPGGGPQGSAFDSSTLALLGSFFAYDPGFTGGVFVGAWPSRVEDRGLRDHRA